MPINVTNLLVKFVSNNKGINKNQNLPAQQNSGNVSNSGENVKSQVQQTNISSNNSVNQNTNVQQNSNISSNINNAQSLQSKDGSGHIINNAINNSQQSINLNNNNNVNNILNRELVYQQIMNTNGGLNTFFNTINNAKTNILANNLAYNLSLANEKLSNINYVKQMMNLPQNIDEVLTLIQGSNKNNSEMSQVNAKLLLSNIDIKTLTLLIQSGSKDALKHIMELSTIQNFSKTELQQIKDAIAYLNTSSSSQESQTQALKNFMLLYLPWLPLQEGTDFDLDFSFTGGSEDADENILNISIVTKNYGEIHILIILKSISSFEIYIQCIKTFPKNILLKLIGEDQQKYTIQTNITFEEQKQKEPTQKAQKAQIMLSNIKEISPFLLLIANSLIKYTLLLDSQAV